ncbi:hypothetical protein G6O69_38955 [Pseudenhygromyxa sp. WMMC2535]|uniref:hypothetical protein n=1 Tax=Pseudenhygromyxa sp. WMMC2535 TaxID=2712867 RepID=UPI0015957C42|nr:hypothetical protein [Pseudenhygromyxa sp. WMMC2535]NVB43839.1 hypothetical protein [Pseudenhygromyxa sp. WMMC2535]
MRDQGLVEAGLGLAEGLAALGEGVALALEQELEGERDALTSAARPSARPRPASTRPWSRTSSAAP